MSLKGKSKGADKSQRCWVENLDASRSFSHDFTVTPLIIKNVPTLTYLSFRYRLQGHCKVTFSSQQPITAGWRAACVKVCFSRGLPNPNGISDSLITRTTP